MMEHKKDIGTLFEEKLQNKTVTPKNNLWKDVDTALTQRAKRRKKIYWSWGIVTGILIIAGIVFSSIISKNNNDPIKQSSPLTTTTQSDLEPHKKAAVSTIDSVENKPLRNSIDSTSKTSENREKTISTSSDKKLKKSRGEQVEKGFDSFRKKTVYRYYNSQDGTTIETTNKALIDSLIKLEKTTIKVDSTN